MQFHSLEAEILQFQEFFEKHNYSTLEQAIPAQIISISFLNVSILRNESRQNIIIRILEKKRITVSPTKLYTP